MTARAVDAVLDCVAQKYENEPDSPAHENLRLEYYQLAAAVMGMPLDEIVEAPIAHSDIVKQAMKFKEERDRFYRQYRELYCAVYDVPFTEDVLYQIIGEHEDAIFEAQQNVKGAARALVLKERLTEQTKQTQDTYQQIFDAVVETLRRYNVVPVGFNPNEHPVEQVVGTCVKNLLILTKG
jgi:hypothetical protein